MLRKSILALGLFLWTLTAQASVQELLNDSSDPVRGNPKGQVTVVEFYDYQCGHCVNMVFVMDSLIKAHPDVRFVFKDLPVMGETSQFAARAALAAHLQGKYTDFSHTLFANSDTLTETSVLALAKKAGLNMTKLQQDMSSPKVLSQLQSNIALSKQLRLRGTPAFLIGKTDATKLGEIDLILGEASLAQLEGEIDKFSA